jgi:ABC-2 type transport system permease protein
VRGALHAEWTKLRTVAEPGALLLGALVLTVGLSALVSGSASCPTAGCATDPVRASLTGVQLGQAVMAVFGVLAVGSEYSTGMMATTLTAVPRRGRVLTSKAAIVALPVLAASSLAVLGSLLAGRLLLPGGGFTSGRGFAPISIADGPTLRAATGSILYLALVALLSVGVTVVVRDSAAAVGLVLGLLYLFPVLVHVVSDARWQRHIEQIAPSTAGLNVQATIHLDHLSTGPWAGLGVLALWACAALVAAYVALAVRDA